MSAFLSHCTAALRNVIPEWAEWQTPGTPQACIFQFAFYLLLYNLIQVPRGYLAEAHDEEPAEISTEKLFEDVEEQLIA